MYKNHGIITLLKALYKEKTKIPSETKKEK